jgi:hypothetical protein
MKCWFVLLLSIIVFRSFAEQPDNKSLGHAIKDFDRALLTKDSVTLRWILEDQVTYGHSNGWIESKKEVIADLFNGKLTYKEIRPNDQQVVIEGKAASVRYNVEIDVLMDGKSMQFKLKVLQMWLWENEHWVLLARQSVKV